VSEVSQRYIGAILALPAFAEWRVAGLKEPWVMQGNEPDWPLVRGV
jgi:glutathione S-transferase